MDFDELLAIGLTKLNLSRKDFWDTTFPQFNKMAEVLLGQDKEEQMSRADLVFNEREFNRNMRDGNYKRTNRC